MNQLPNAGLFEYILAVITAEGGDGDAAVLFKIQNPNNVTEDFERYLKSIGKRSDWKRGGTNTFYRGQECIAFFSATTKHNGPYPPTAEPSLNANWQQWDTFIVTF